jgi:hypothetical protein
MISKQLPYRIVPIELVHLNFTDLCSTAYLLTWPRGLGGSQFPAPRPRADRGHGPARCKSPGQTSLFCACRVIVSLSRSRHLSSPQYPGTSCQVILPEARGKHRRSRELSPVVINYLQDVGAK